MFLLRYWKAAIALVLAAALWGHGYYTCRMASLYALQVERTHAEQVISEMARAEADAQARARKAEQAMAAGVEDAENEAGRRNDQIEADYERRIAGVVSERDRLRDLWQGHQATDRLSGDSEAARSADEQDRLRRESAARIVRAVEQVQSERDEVIDRYEAVRQSINSKTGGKVD